MCEFMIRWLGNEPNMGANYNYDAILRPKTFSWHPIYDREVYGIEVNGRVFYFSWEMPGIQVILRGNILSPEVAQQVVKEIKDNIVAETGAQAEVLYFDADSPGVIYFPDMSS